MHGKEHLVAIPDRRSTAQVFREGTWKFMLNVPNLQIVAGGYLSDTDAKKDCESYYRFVKSLTGGKEDGKGKEE